jgi:hypothetical protein
VRLAAKAVSVGETRAAAPCMWKKINALSGELKRDAASTSASTRSSEIFSVKAERQ